MNHPTLAHASSFPASRSLMYAATPNSWIPARWCFFLCCILYGVFLLIAWAGVRFWSHVACFISSSHKNCSSPDVSCRARICSVHVHIPHSATPFCCCNHGHGVHALCLSCPGAVWGHRREILPLDQSMLLWCNFWSASQLVAHCTCMNQWFDSFSLGNRAQFCGLHCLCALPHMNFCWGFGLKLVPTGPSGCALHISLCEFPIPLGRVAELLWPWHMPCRIQALTQGQAGYQ